MGGKEKDKKWIQNMPSWNKTTIWFTLMNFLVISGASTSLWYSEGQLVNGTIFYDSLDIPFQHFLQKLLSIYTYVFLGCGVIGVVVGVCTSYLNKSRQRTMPERYNCDGAFDFFAFLYIMLLAALLFVALAGSILSTSLYISAVNMPADCPGNFGTEAPPLSHCFFDNAAYMLVEGSLASNQFSLMWNNTQETLYCCGYFCEESSLARECRDTALWQMERCYHNIAADKGTCRQFLLYITVNYMFYAVGVGWGATVLSVLMLAFICQFRVHINGALNEWVK